MLDTYQEFSIMVKELKSPHGDKLMQSGVGMATEVGEYLDQIKKHVFQDRELDVVNLKEELGDILFYLELGCQTLGISLYKVMEANISKLRSRYPQGFNTNKSKERNIEAERKLLERATSVNS